MDQVLVARGLVDSRSRARDLISRSLVLVDGVLATKPAQGIAASNTVALATEAPAFVSRGADKLLGGLAAFGFTCTGNTVIDVGASTGGFTEVLLRQGAARVYAVDVGRGQLHARLRADARVVSLEATDARALTREMIAAPVTAIVADVSFISLTKALPAALRLAEPAAWLVALIKPQFEVGPAHVGKGGIVRDGAARDAALAEVRRWLTSDMGWHVTGVAPSPITGGDGNQEFLIGAVKPGLQSPGAATP